jgi:hypothetical protein
MTAAPAAPRPRARRLRRAAVLTAGAIGVALALSGCMKLDLAMTLQPGDTVDGSFVVALDKKLLEATGLDPEEAFGDAASSAPIPGADDLGGAQVTTETYDEDGLYGQRISFTGAPLSVFSGGADGADGLSITRDGDLYVVSGRLDLADVTGDAAGAGGELGDLGDLGGLGGLGDLGGLQQTLLDSLQVRLAVSFPGEVVEHNGELDGTTVTWSPKAGETLDISATGYAEGDGTAAGSGSGSVEGSSSDGTAIATKPASAVSTLLPWAVAALVLLGLAAILVVFLRRGAKQGAVSPIDRAPAQDDDPFLLGGSGAPAAADLGRPDLASPPHDTVVIPDSVDTTVLPQPSGDAPRPPAPPA